MDSDAHALALKRAKELQTNLSKKHPSFIKQMLPSHVTRWFMLDIPEEFCRLHLPTHNNVEFILEDENGESYMVKLLPTKKGRFNGGWKRFSVACKVFHLIRPCYFKVYIVRVNDDPTAVGSANVSSSGKMKRKHEAADEKGPRLTPHQDTQKSARLSQLPSNSSFEPGSGHYNKDIHSSDIEALSLSGRVADFEKFKITVNNEIIDPELSRSTRFKYYKLCCSQKSYLHHKLLGNVNCTLAAGIIMGTLEIADTIRACKPNTPGEDYAMWDNTLEGFERLGMDVGFLRGRLKRLVRLASKFRETEKLKREAKKERDRVGEKMRSTEMQYLNLKRATYKLKEEMKTMKINIKKCKDAYLEEADAPW